MCQKVVNMLHLGVPSVFFGKSIRYSEKLAGRRDLQYLKLLNCVIATSPQRFLKPLGTFII